MERLERPTRQELEAAASRVDGGHYEDDDPFTLLAELRAMQVENELLREDKLKRDDLIEQVRSMKTENEHIMRQLTAARLMLRQCTHERVNPCRDPFGGMGV